MGGKLVLYIEVDHVPWRPPDPGWWTVPDLVRLLEDARMLGLVFTVYASPRTRAAFPALADFIAGEGQRMVATRVEDAETRWPRHPANGHWWLRVNSGTPAATLRKRVDGLSSLGWTL